jgi:hypothetical protein
VPQCTLQVGSNYDISKPCSQALPKFAECGGNTPFACGYGLACVARSVRSARCLPICSKIFNPKNGFGAITLRPYFLGVVAAGCKEDGQAVVEEANVGGSSLGTVDVDEDGTAVPLCVKDINIGSNERRPKRIPPAPKPGSPGAPKAPPPAANKAVAARQNLARQVVGLSSVFYEGKRAGLEPVDAIEFPQV